MNSSSSTPPAPLASALTTGRALVLLQLLTRLLTFVLNQTLVRLAPPEVFGTAAIQFDLVSSTILFLSREGVRNALLRGNPSGSQQDITHEAPKTENQSKNDVKRANSQLDTETKASSHRHIAWMQLRLAQIPFHLGLLVSLIVTTVYLFTSSTQTKSQPHFHLSLCLYVLAALTELSIEPWYISAIRSDPPKLRIRIQGEGGMAIVKSIVTVIVLVLDPSNQSAKGGRGKGRGGNALLGFALGQLAGAIWLAGRYIFEYGVNGLVWTPISKEENRYDPSALRLAMANTRQGVVKHVLTEADRIAVGRISPLGDQGGYAVAINYGSLIARIIFQPIEETLLLHFSSSPPTTTPSTLPLFTFILHISTHLLLFLPIFLPPLLPLLLPYLLPRRYAATSAATTLQTYLTWYIPLMSINGIVEAFHAATASPSQVARQARWMVGSSVAFAGGLAGLTLWNRTLGEGARRQVGGKENELLLSVLLIKPPTTEQALIYASCIAMIVRILYAYNHARSIAQTTSSTSTSTLTRNVGVGIPISRVLPKVSTVLASFVAGVILRVSQAYLGTSFGASLGQLAIGVLLGLGTLAVTAWVEREDFKLLQRLLRSKTE